MPVAVPTEGDFEELTLQVEGIEERVSALEGGGAGGGGEPPAPDQDHYAVTITVDGKQITLRQRDAIELEEYSGGSFIQRCLLAEHPRLPAEVKVWFRPDLPDEEDGSVRMEIVVETGSVRQNLPARNIAQYTVRIWRGGRQVYHETVNNHWYRSRWRWQSRPRPVLLTWEQLADHPCVPRYDGRLSCGFTPSASSYCYDGPMDLAGIYPNMTATGERFDIGPVTEYIAEYLCTGSDMARGTLLAQAEASGSLPWHFRDEETLAPLNTIDHSSATIYAATPTSQWPTVAMPADTGIELDVAHQPQLAAIPFLMTGDPYYLEELQFAATYNLLSGPRTAPAQWGSGQVRAYAWSLRTLALAAALTPEDAPSWLLPRAYWVEQLERCRQYSEDRWINQVNASYTEHFPAYDVFRVIGANFGDAQDGALQPNTYVASWEEDFATTIIAWVVVMGFESWRPMLNYKVQDTIARVTPASGWVRARPSVYHHPLRDNPDAPWYGGWAEAWDALERIVPGSAQYDDPDRLSPNVGEPLDRFCYARGALAMAARAGVEAAREPLDWLNQELERLITDNQGITRWKWCIRP